MLLVDDAVIDLIGERIDIALRVGKLADSNLVARRLGAMPVQMCASPAYLMEHGWPQHPDDLIRHAWLGARPLAGNVDRLTLTGPQQEKVEVSVTVKAQASQVTALHSLCVAGWGISVVASEDDRRAVADGRLVPVLNDWKLPDFLVYALTPRKGEQPAKVRHALTLLTDYVRSVASTQPH